MAGRNSRANIDALDESDLEGLQIVPTFRVGPFSWDRRIVRRALSDGYTTVILGPATLSLSTWAILIGRRVARRRTFLWGQCGRYGDRSLKRHVQELMNRLATGLLVYGKKEANAATQLGLDSRKVTVVNNATHSNEDVLRADDHEEQLARAQRAAYRAKTEGDLRILFVGRLNADKRLDVLLRATEQLRQRYPSTVIDLIGDGDARDDLRKNFPEEWVRFHGWVYDTEELAHYFQAATFVCSPFHMGLLAIDALRAGTPVLVPDNPMNGSEVEALTPGINAVRFPPGEERGILLAAESWFRAVEEIDAVEFREARTTALSTWDPVNVAASIRRATAD
ncbi:glycosyltransferase [Leucobacter sp. wl10]|nr:glycosyltransferase [Leucobacter sp. wl10]